MGVAATLAPNDLGPQNPSEKLVQRLSIGLFMSAVILKCSVLNLLPPSRKYIFRGSKVLFFRSDQFLNSFNHKSWVWTLKIKKWIFLDIIVGAFEIFRASHVIKTRMLLCSNIATIVASFSIVIMIRAQTSNYKL